MRQKFSLMSIFAGTVLILFSANSVFTELRRMYDNYQFITSWVHHNKIIDYMVFIMIAFVDLLIRSIHLIVVYPSIQYCLIGSILVLLIWKK
jgi:hypothetical protein